MRTRSGLAAALLMVLSACGQGALTSREMPQFSDLTDDQVEALRQYVEAQARADSPR